MRANKLTPEEEFERYLATMDLSDLDGMAEDDREVILGVVRKVWLEDYEQHRSNPEGDFWGGTGFKPKLRIVRANGESPILGFLTKRPEEGQKRATEA